MVTVTHDREPLRMTRAPTEPGKEVATDFWRPINTEDYVLVVICKQSRWAVMDFVTSTSTRAVVPRLDRMFPSLGIPVSACSDNGPRVQ